MNEKIDKQAVEEMAKHCAYYHNGNCKNTHPFVEECDLMCDMFGTFANLEKAGYRRQSENTIELPCKVGDTMYTKYDGVVFPVVVNAIRLDTKKNSNRICVTGTIHLYGDYSHDYKATFPFNSIGKSLFYTEAEAKMKGGKG